MISEEGSITKHCAWGQACLHAFGCLLASELQIYIFFFFKGGGAELLQGRSLQACTQSCETSVKAAVWSRDAVLGQSKIGRAKKQSIWILFKPHKHMSQRGFTFDGIWLQGFQKEVSHWACVSLAENWTSFSWDAHSSSELLVWDTYGWYPTKSPAFFFAWEVT